MADYVKAFKKPFTDIKSLLIGIALSIVPIVSFFSMGYYYNLANDKSAKLPEFKDWGDLFVKGLLGFLIGLIYSLPAIIILSIGAFSIFGSIIAFGLTGDTANLTLMISQLIAALPFFLVALIFGVIAAYLVPAATINYVFTEKFSAGFEFKKIMKKAFSGAYFAAWIVSILAYIALAVVLGWIWILGPATIMFVGGAIGYTLLGQAFRQA